MSPASHLESARTLATPVAPNPPTELTLTPGDTVVRASWSGATGTITGYDLRLIETTLLVSATDNDYRPIPITTTQTTFTTSVGTLTNGTEYLTK